VVFYGLRCSPSSDEVVVRRFAARGKLHDWIERDSQFRTRLLPADELVQLAQRAVDLGRAEWPAVFVTRFRMSTEVTQR